MDPKANLSAHLQIAAMTNCNQLGITNERAMINFHGIANKEVRDLYLRTSLWTELDHRLNANP